MITPTREQVDSWRMKAYLTDPMPAATLMTDSAIGCLVTLARAALESTIAEQAAEIASLKETEVHYADCCDAERELRQQLAAQQAYAEQLREASGKILTEVMDMSVANGANSVSMPDDYVALAALISIPHDTYALREYCARVVEKVATMTLSTYALKTIAALIREGTFVPD